MKKRIVISLLCCFLAAPALSADRVTTVPVQFAKGASSAQLKGTFAGYDSVQYTVNARQDQQMTVSIAGSSNANFNVFGPGATPGEVEALGTGYVGGDWTAKLPASGTYTIQVYQTRATARKGAKVPHTLTVSIK
ncbi:g-type lysozyme inhibitor [Atlantibacter hermannii]|uniref:g-type lysozyme inhibitor n=1 Tax=Atlantibacter hermannii TaxID=565 RepID=UPI00289C6007|nr:g-type lysozyme inhibitor [Atlantibacter hermannii]